MQGALTQRNLLQLALSDPTRHADSLIAFSVVAAAARRRSLRTYKRPWFDGFRLSFFEGEAPRRARMQRESQKIPTEARYRAPTASNQKQSLVSAGLFAGEVSTYPRRPAIIVHCRNSVLVLSAPYLSPSSGRSSPNDRTRGEPGG